MKKLGLKPNIDIYCNYLIKNLENQDAYDLYAYAFFCVRSETDTKELKKHVISRLESCTLNDKSTIGYLMLACKELNINISRVNLKKEITNYITTLVNQKNNSYSTHDLILLFGASKCKLIEINKNTIISLSDMNISNSEDVHAITTYYRYSIIQHAEQQLNSYEKLVDLTQMQNDINELRCTGGFKMNTDDNFFDLQSTYYIIMLIE